MKLENSSLTEPTVNLDVKKSKLDTDSRPPDILYDNTRQGIIRIPEDRLELRARDFKDAIEKSVDWKTPLGIFVTFIVCVSTSDFKPQFGFSADEISHFIWALLFASGFWFCYSAFSAFSSSNKITKPIDFVQSCKTNYTSHDD